jgi:hypothetical protein
MAAFDATMRQLGPNRWVFEPPDVAPMKASCASCAETVAILKPQATLPSGVYIIRGECECCGDLITLVFQEGG